MKENCKFWSFITGSSRLNLHYVFCIYCSAQEFCSVGDDSCLILWDARTGSSPAIKVRVVSKSNYL